MGFMAFQPMANQKRQLFQIHRLGLYLAARLQNNRGKRKKELWDKVIGKLQALHPEPSRPLTHGFFPHPTGGYKPRPNVRQRRCYVPKPTMVV